MNRGSRMETHVMLPERLQHMRKHRLGAKPVREIHVTIDTGALMRITEALEKSR